MSGKLVGKEPEAIQRWSPRRKRAAVRRVLKGEAIDTVSRELRVPVHVLRGWHTAFVAAGTTGLKTRRATESGDLRAARAKIGERLMKNELLENKDLRLARSPKWTP